MSKNKCGVCYLAVATEHLRDGTERNQRVCHTKAEAIEYLDSFTKAFAGCNYSYELYEVGIKRQIPLEVESVEELGPRVVTKRVREVE